MAKTIGFRVLLVLTVTLLVAGGAQLLKTNLKDFAAKNKSADVKTTKPVGDDLWVDRLHMQGNFLIQQGALLRHILGLGDAQAKNGNKKSAENNNLKACFKGLGKNCKKFQSPNFNILKDPAGEYNARVTLQGKLCKSNFGGNIVPEEECLVERKTTYKIICPSPSSCDSVQVELQSDYKGSPKTPAFTRKSLATVMARNILGADTTKTPANSFPGKITKSPAATAR